MYPGRDSGNCRNREFSMKILIIGSGGREHALAWKIAQSSLVKKIFCAPGNAGMAEIAENVPLPVSDHKGLLDFALENRIDLTVVGPEDPLVEGIVDLFADAGLKIFGPRQAAARLEGSKSFSKNLMKKHGIPTAGYEVFSSLENAQRYIQNYEKYPVVLKASGLAAGKGVLICHSREEALAGLNLLMGDKLFGSAGDEVVVEEFLSGEEISVFVLSDGKEYRLLTTSQDHKKALDGDAGKNTGGMGAYAPAPVATAELLASVEENIVRPSLDAIARESVPYTGLLYIGLILTGNGPKVLEYNCRFGDPETEVVLPLLKSDLVPVLLACATGELHKYNIEVYPHYAIDVVLASGGYPDDYEKGKEISGLDALSDDVIVFHAGTRLDNGRLVTSGGRVLNIVTTGKDFAVTRDYLYNQIKKINFDKMHFRNDIGFRALAHLNE